MHPFSLFSLLHDYAIIFIIFRYFGQLLISYAITADIIYFHIIFTFRFHFIIDFHIDISCHAILAISPPDVSDFGFISAAALRQMIIITLFSLQSHYSHAIGHAIDY
jgi:hypothetical protein